MNQNHRQIGYLPDETPSLPKLLLIRFAAGNCNVSGNRSSGNYRLSYFYYYFR